MVHLIILCSIFCGLALSLNLPAQASTSEHFEGQVIGIADGDTITVLHNARERKIRLSGIDSPEKKQAFGSRAKQYTSDLAYGKTIQVDVKSTDRYGRSIAEVTLPDGRNLNDLILENGYAWWYQKYSKNAPHRGVLETDARTKGRGLWAAPRPEPPWQFRAAKNSMRKENNSEYTSEPGM